MNPHKCAFGVSTGQFLGFMVHEKGIEVGQKIFEAISKIVHPTSKTELQSLIGKFNSVRRFISNLSTKVLLFSTLLKLKNDQELKWETNNKRNLKRLSI